MSVKKIIEEFHLFLSNEQLKLEGTAQLTLYFSAGISEAASTFETFQKSFIKRIKHCTKPKGRAETARLYFL